MERQTQQCHNPSSPECSVVRPILVCLDNMIKTDGDHKCSTMMSNKRVDSKRPDSQITMKTITEPDKWFDGQMDATNFQQSLPFNVLGHFC